MDKASLYFISDPQLKVEITAPCIYIAEGAVLIEADTDGKNVRGFPFSQLASFHITKEYESNET